MAELSPLAGYDLVGHLAQVAADYVRLLAGRVKNHAWSGDERGCAASADGSRHIPRVNGDQAEVTGLDPEPLGSHVERLAGGLQAFGQVRRKRLLEEAS